MNDEEELQDPPFYPPYLAPHVAELFRKYEQDRQDSYKAKSLAGVKAKALKRSRRARRKHSG